MLHKSADPAISHRETSQRKVPTTQRKAHSPPFALPSTRMESKFSRQNSPGGWLRPVSSPKVRSEFVGVPQLGVFLGFAHDAGNSFSKSFVISSTIVEPRM